MANFVILKRYLNSSVLKLRLCIHLIECLNINACGYFAIQVVFRAKKNTSNEHHLA